MDDGPFTLRQILEDERDKLGLGQNAPVGLALSGGGIRSATFSLGVLQALARRKRLASFDYLSTVSGGGYIGSWLSAWIHRCGLERVQNELGQIGSSASSGAPVAVEPAEVTWLRRYSSYLAPRVGILSLDSLTLITTWSRNFLLNLVILIACLGVAFLLPLHLMRVFGWATSHYVAFGYAAAWMGFLFLCGVAYNLWHQGLPVQRRRNWLISSRGVGWSVVLPGVLAACFGAVWLLGAPDKSPKDALSGSWHVAALLCLLFIPWAVAERLRGGLASMLRELPVFVIAATGGLAAAVAALAGLYFLWQLWKPAGNEAYLAAVAALGPPGLLVAFGIGTSIFTGLVGRVYFERSREWWSRLNAWLLTLGGVWAAWGLLSYFSLPVLLWGADHLGNWISLLGTGWIGTLAAAIFLRTPEGTSQKVQLRVERALNAASIVFIAGLLFVVAAGTHWILLRTTGTALEPEKSVEVMRPSYEVRAPDGKVALQVAPVSESTADIVARVSYHFKSLAQLREHRVLGVPTPEAAMGGLMLIMLLFGWRVDINKFSLHNMYKNRLVRCYLGASNGDTRNEQPFTGLDDDDDVELRRLVGVREVANGQSVAQVQRPLHLINTALNITQGKNLAWQERKAASFIFSPLYCGYALARTQGDSRSIESTKWDMRGYRRTALFASRDQEELGFKLGMALATSGAAVSPNMGHASRPSRAFVLTLFNVRLGRWTPNPARLRWRSSSPKFGLIPLLQESLGYSNEESDYVYLSDGGHFDNLGVYELVRRRCKVIFAVDAAADPKRAMGDLADTIRKCRVDLGVEIEVADVRKLYGDTDMRAETSYSIGAIHYDLNDPSADGVFVLLKPTIGRGRDEPVDLQHYAEENKPFPQQTTADQFFDESQFESYRRLGFLVADNCLKETEKLLPVVPPQDLEWKTRTIIEAPAFSTRLVGWLLRGRSDPSTLPSRDDSLIDFFILALLILLAMLLGFWAIDKFSLGLGAGVCWLPDDCFAPIKQVLQTTLDGDRRFWVFVRMILDSAFVVVYAAAFLLSYFIATHLLPRRSYRKPLRAVLVGLVLVLVVVDFAENFAILDALSWQNVTTDRIESISVLTAMKFVLTGLCLLSAFLLSRWIHRAFLRRWYPQKFQDMRKRRNRRTT